MHLYLLFTDPTKLSLILLETCRKDITVVAGQNITVIGLLLLFETLSSVDSLQLKPKVNVV